MYYFSKKLKQVSKLKEIIPRRMLCMCLKTLMN